MGCCQWCSDLFVRPHDSPENVWIKRSILPALLFTLFIETFFTSLAFANYDYLAGSGMFLPWMSSLIFLFIAKTGALSLGFALDQLILLHVVGILIGDFALAATASARGWALVVILVDVALFYERNHLTNLIVAFTVVYLAVERVEAVTRLGMYDLASIGHAPPITVCECADPPCRRAVASGVAHWLAFVSVLLIDFYLTRGFARSLRQQLRVVRATVRVSENIAESLARYEVDEAALAIEAEGKALPAALRSSFDKLLSNLNEYKGYLPDSLLQKDEVQRVNVPPPGVEVESPEVGIVFTDVQSSTVLWEMLPQAMHEALRIHNFALREVACHTSGYEVKVIGDALMLAFSNAEGAFDFGIEAQQQLVQCAWPVDLYEHPLCARVEGSSGPEAVVWSGLRVRIGMNYGPVRAERNPVTGRFDYFGHTVNTAARVEGALKHGGLTGVTEAALKAV
eukprot:Hpha_TRINITY_DN17649_c0_g1::TRINITY_DN17649_c0_g1_i1::g.158824::m.158824